LSDAVPASETTPDSVLKTAALVGEVMEIEGALESKK
jgi:hypothetical protein